MTQTIDLQACPKCNQTATRVMKTNRRADGVVLRRRCCRTCDHRWYTIQPREEFVASYRVCFERSGTPEATFTILPIR